MPIHFNKLASQLGLSLASSVAVLAGTVATQQALAREVALEPRASTIDRNEPTAQAVPQEVPLPQETPVEAQEATGEEDQIVEQVVIIGTKSNLLNAQIIKRDADTMVDAVSSADIRVLENRSVLDAMQRMPGISLERFSAPNDPDRFSVEASNVIVRGMTQTRSEFNGRDSFTANSGRGLSYQDVPPELMGSIEVYKNQTADMVEGGIGGTVTLQTRKPFDSDERVLAFSTDVSWGDLARELSPSFSGLYSDRWTTGIGEFGLLLNYANSTLYGESHGIQSDTFTQFLASDLVVEDSSDPGARGTRAEDFLGEDGLGMVWMPNSANVLIKRDERTREGFTAALQYRDPNDTVVATLEYIRSDANLTWNERSLKYQGGYHTPTTRRTRPLAGTYITFDEDGLFLAGTLSNGRDSWRVGRSGTNRVPKGNLFSQFPQWGHSIQMDSRLNDTTSLVEDTSFNLLWNATDRLQLSADFQYIQAETSRDDVSVHINTWAHVQYDIRGSVPSLTYIEPWNGARDAARAESAKKDEISFWDTMTDGEPDWPGFGGDPAGDQNYFQDENSYFWRSAMDHYERSEGDSTAVRLDGSYAFDHNFVRSIKAGIRFSERQQVIRATAWNWGALAPEWQDSPSNWDLEEGETMGGGIGWLPDIESQRDGVEYVDWSNFMGGGVFTIQGHETIHASEDLIRSVMGRNPDRVLLHSTDFNNWEPYPTRDGLDSKYGLFRPDEMNTTRETTNAVYLRLDFGGEGALPYSGNIGLRYINMERIAVGVVEFPGLPPVDRPNVRPVPEGLSLPLTPDVVDAYLHQQVADGHFNDFGAAANSLEHNWAKNVYNYLSDDERAFSLTIQDPDDPQVYHPARDVLEASADYDILLPSFNIKVDLTNTLVGRFAIAKAVAFADMGDVRNRIEFAPLGLPDITSVPRFVETDEGRSIELIESASLNPKEEDLLWVGGGGNPHIRPMESIQYDFSLEWYFSDVGQLSAAIFHKNLDNYFTQGVITREFTHPISQSTQNTAVTSTRNGGKAKLDGLELTYHQFFTGMFEGFGVQATYTYIDAHSMPNNERDIANERWFNSRWEDTGIRVNFDRLPLEGQSDHTVNFMGIYENDRWSARLAYNWRSKYLLTTRDVISKAPLWYDDHGELDGSVFYHLSDNFTLGLQAINITKARSDLLMILNDDLVTTGRSSFMSDRRLSLVLRGEF